MIAKEVATNGDKVTEFLELISNTRRDVCLDRALSAAVKNDNHINVSKLVLKGAKNLQECLRYAKNEKKPHARAMLLMIMAAQTGEKAIIQRLFGEPAPDLQNEQEYQDVDFHRVQEAMLSGNVSTVVPIEIARLNCQSQVREYLLFKTGVNEERGCVYWHRLRLHQLEISWLRKIAWVRKLILGRNGFKNLPLEIATYLKWVTINFYYMACI